LKISNVIIYGGNTLMGKKTKKTENFKFKNGNGVEYEVFFKKPNSKYYADADGYCHDPKEKDPKIYINPYLTKQSELNTIIHEMAHAFFWDKPEKDIFAYANAVSRMLFNHQQWRKIEKDNYERTKKSSKNKSQTRGDND
jgi:Zn-dependent peptidase ImmA (M78 family)